MIIGNGGTVANGHGYVGYASSANSNWVWVTDAGSLWSNNSDLYIGNSGSGNSMVIFDGGTVVNASGFIGNGGSSSNNSVWVIGAGSLWNNSGNLSVGLSGAGNQLVIINGGVVRTLGNFSLGTNASLLNSGSGALYVGGNFSNSATNQAGNDFSGTTVFNGSSGGGSYVTQTVEVASVFAQPGLGSATNFYFGTFQVGDPITGSNAWVQLVDNQVNTAGGGNETLAASNLIVALAQSVLDLNNRTSFVWNLSNAGTILQTNANPPGVVTRLDVVNTFTNAGTVLVGNGSVLQFSNAFINAGVLQLQNGGVLTNFVAGSVLTNSANGSIAGNGLVTPLIENDGTVTASGGLLRLTAGFASSDGGQVNAGLLQALGGGANLQVEQSFINSGTIWASNRAAFTTTASAPVRNDGLITIVNQSTATFGAAVTNTGTITVQNQSVLNFNAGLTNNGTLSFAPAVNPSTAIISGTLTLGSGGIISLGNLTNNTLVVRGNFVNGSTNNNSFDMANGVMVFGAAGPLTTNTFEVAGANLGATFAGFSNNFAIGTLNITNGISFVNNINNGGGLGTNEALYVDVLHLFSGATMKLSALTIYVGLEFVYEDSNGTKTFTSGVINQNNEASLGLLNVSMDNGGQIVFIPEPSTYLLLALGFGGLALRRRRSKDARRHADAQPRPDGLADPRNGGTNFDR